MKKSYRARILFTILVVMLLIDQITKILVKTNMCIGESIPVFGNWFQIYFIENEGMAFGMKFGGAVGKVILTLARVFLVGFLYYYIKKMYKANAPFGVLVGFTLIIVGALGNIFDSLFYGLIFSESTFTQVAQFMPDGGGYANFFMGKVVDMLYCPIISTTIPQWVPIWGGDQFEFFRPIFNVADSCISVGAIYIIIFKWKYFFSKESNK